MAQEWVRHSSVVVGLWGHRKIPQELEGHHIPRQEPGGHRMSPRVHLQGHRKNLVVGLRKSPGLVGHYKNLR